MSSPRRPGGASDTSQSPIKRAWWKECSVYQIYPASFCSSGVVSSTPSSLSGGHGDIPGIISKLDYVKSLGVDVVWLSPILASPQVDMGYDISDYKAIYPPYGTMEDHDAMIKGLHERGMKYVMDLVVNHTSDQHEWFKQSRSSKDNPYRDWYIWRPARYNDKGERIPPNNWEAIFSGSAWEWDEQTQEYYLHLFATAQPDLNWENPKVVAAVHDIIRFWLDRGVDGFRMDVINFISKVPGLPDGDITKPGFLQSGVKHFASGPRFHEFMRDIGRILHEYDAFSVGEMPGVHDTEEILKGVGQDSGELAMAFQFEIVDLDHQPGMERWYPRAFKPRELKAVVNKWQRFMIDNRGWNALYMENHDQGRTVSRYASDEPRYRTKSAKMLAAHLVFQSGTPFVYQGQELAQKSIPESWGIAKYKDIEALNHWKTVLRDYPDDREKQEMFRRQYRLIGRDSARTPMQWNADAETSAGFMPRGSTQEPWMSIHEDFADWNADKLMDDPVSIFHYWRKSLAFRKSHKDIFVYGNFEMLDMEHESVVAYLRTAESNSPGKTKTLVVANFSGDEVQWKVPEHAAELLKRANQVQELGNYHPNEGEVEVGKSEEEGMLVKLRPWEVVVGVA